MTQVPSLREQTLDKIPGAREALNLIRGKAKTTGRTLEAIGETHKAAMTKEEIAKGVIDDMKTDLTKILGKYVEIDDKMAGEITAMVLSAALSNGAETVEEVPAEPPIEEMATDDPESDTELLDDEDDPLERVKAYKAILAEQQSLTKQLTLLNDRLMKSQEATEQQQETMVKSMQADSVTLKALSDRVLKLETAAKFVGRAATHPSTREGAYNIPAEVEKEMQAALEDYVDDPVLGKLRRVE